MDRAFKKDLSNVLKGNELMKELVGGVYENEDISFARQMDSHAKVTREELDKAN